RWTEEGGRQRDLRSAPISRPIRCSGRRLGCSVMTTDPGGVVKQILVINPNSSPQVTAQIDEAVQAALRFGPVAATTMGSDDGPAAIESDEDVARSVPVISQLVKAHSADAYVIACFADPGVDEVRSITDKPVFGIAESGVLTAMARGRRVAVVSGSEAAVRRHTRYWKAIGVADRIMADLPVGLGVLALA